jgi:hypothetical protein
MRPYRTWPPSSSTAYPLALVRARPVDDPNEIELDAGGIRRSGSSRRLLPQPHGLERFGLLGELIHAHDLAVAERENIVETGVDLNPASPATRSEADSRDHAVTRVGELLGNQLVVVPFVLPARRAGANRIMSLRSRFLHRVPNDAGIDVHQRLVEVIDEEPVHDLHILLSNSRSPRLQRGGFEGTALAEALELAHEALGDALLIFSAWDVVAAEVLSESG